MTSRDEAIEQASLDKLNYLDENGKKMVMTMYSPDDFSCGARWADENPEVVTNLSTATGIMMQEVMKQETERYQRIIKDYPKLEAKLKIAEEALDLIGNPGTQSLYECRDKARETLNKIRDANE